MEKLRAVDVSGRVYDLVVDDTHADIDSVVRENLNYGCGCDKDHGKTPCDKRFVSVQHIRGGSQ